MCSMLCSVRNAEVLNGLTRPNGGPGLWIAGLLPLTLSVNLWKHYPVGQNYQTNCLLAWMVLAVQLLILIKHTSRSKAVVDLSFGCSVILATITALIITLVINQSPLIGVAGAVLVTFVVEWTFCGLLYHLRKSFTIGEAAVVSQGLLLFLFNSLALDLSTALLQPQLIRAEGVDEDIETVEHGLRHIIQLGILMIFVLIGFMRALGERVQKLILFAPLLTLIGLGVIAIPVTQPIPIIFIFKFLFNDLNKLILLSIFAGLSLITAIFCQWQVSGNRATSTTKRKLFHAITVIVFLIGLLQDRLLLFLCTGLVFAIFLLLEAIRVARIPFLSNVLDQTVKAFVDSQDSGIIALTPMYLLVGCALPLVLSPVAFSGGPEALLPLLSGVISVGIGDSFAGVVGMYCGKHRWPNSKKSLEGTVANALSQLLAIGGLMAMGFLPKWTTVVEPCICLAGVMTNAIIEAKTDQVDNLVVPLLTFLLFSLI